ncbi:hypothetical protein ABIB82_006965, partial [Bradyrhizobium sp. i1.8.4]
LVIVSPDSRDNLARRQAETPLIALFRFPEPALYSCFVWVMVYFCSAIAAVAR